MDVLFKIFFERLRDGEREFIDEKVSPAFLNLQDEDLAFKDPVKIEGEAYLTDDHLIICLKVSTIAQIPCLVCNETVKVKIKVDDFYLAEPFEEMKGGFFDYEAKLRDAILLQIPFFAECNEGKCPERERLSQFFKKSTKDDEASPNNATYHPFSNLDQ